MEEYTVRSLGPGMVLAGAESRQFRTALFSVTLTIPLREETASGAALIPALLVRGCRRWPDLEAVSAETDRLYGASLIPAVRQWGENQSVSLLCSFLNECFLPRGTSLLEEALTLVSSLLLDPLVEAGRFRNDYVLRERRNLAERIQGRVNDKQGWALYRLIQEMCRGEPYAVDRLGTERGLKALRLKDVWTGYRDLLRRANVTFYYCGGDPLDQVQEAVYRQFHPLGFCRRDPLPPCVVKAAPEGAVRTVTDRLSVSQARLALGFRTGGVVLGHPLYPALLVCCALYGGTARSKLFLNVRERLRLCYDVSSMVDKLKGLLVVSAGVDPGELDRAREAILEELEAIRRGEISQKELTAAVQAVSAEMMSRVDSQGRLEDDGVAWVLCGWDLDSEGCLADAVERVQAEDVAEAARLLRLDTVYRLTGKGED